MKREYTLNDFVREMTNETIRRNRPNPKNVNPYDSKAKNRTVKSKK